MLTLSLSSSLYLLGLYSFVQDSLFSVATKTSSLKPVLLRSDNIKKAKNINMKNMLEMTLLTPPIITSMAAIWIKDHRQFSPSSNSTLISLDASLLNLMSLEKISYACQIIC